MHGGTIVDATIIAASSSTKNKEGKRDEEMHQTKKGNQWYFGMKVHPGVDAGSGYVHTIKGTAANVHDVNETVNLVRDDDTVIYGVSGYLNAAKHMESLGGERLSSLEFRLNARPSSIKMSKDYQGIHWDEAIENRKSSTRCKVEHPFLIVKRQFGYCKTAYKGLAKNMNRFNSQYLRWQTCYITLIGTILLFSSKGITADVMHNTAPSPISSFSEDKTEKFFNAFFPGSALIFISTGYIFPFSIIRRSISFPLLSR